MKKIVLGMVAAAAFVCAACSHKTLSTSLAGEWNIISVNGAEIDTTVVEERPYIGFDYAENRVYGTAGCNRFFAEFDMDSVDMSLNFGQTGATRMMCANMEVEDRILNVLNNIANYKVTKENEVELCDAEGASLMLLRKR